MRGRFAAAWILSASIFFLAVSGSPQNLFSAPMPSKDALPANAAAASTPRSSSSAPLDKAAELAEREMALRAREERLLVLRKEVEDKIARYEQLLADIEAKEKQRETEKKEAEQIEAKQREAEQREAEQREAAQKEREAEQREAEQREAVQKEREAEQREAEKKEVSGNIDLLVKLFEAMPAEEAAVRMEAIDEEIAAVILSRMRGRKAGGVLAAMSPKKSAVIVHRIAGNEKNFPAQ